MNKTKALTTAKEYLWPRCMECLHDCCDSSHEAEKLEERFNAHMDDSIPINDFIKKNLRKEFIVALKEAVEEGGEDFDSAEAIESITNPICDLPFTYKEIEKDYLNQK